MNNKCVVWTQNEFIGPCQPGKVEWGCHEVSEDQLTKLTAKRRFLGYGKEPAGGAELLVQYASYGKTGGLLPGYGSFG